MNIQAIDNQISYKSKFVTCKPKVSDIRIFDGQKLLTRVPVGKERFLDFPTTKIIEGLRYGALTENTNVLYGNPEKECFVIRCVFNNTNDGCKVAYKKSTRIFKQKGGCYYLDQTLKNDIYKSKGNIHNIFSFDFKQDNLPKNIVGVDKEEQVTYFTKQPNFFKKVYLNTLTRLITDKNGCERTACKLFNYVSKIINKNIEREPITTSCEDIIDDIVWTPKETRKHLPYNKKDNRKNKKSAEKLLSFLNKPFGPLKIFEF